MSVLCNFASINVHKLAPDKVSELFKGLAMYFRKLLSAVFFFSGISFSTNMTDADLGYSIFLPENWVKETISSTQHCFYDTTYSYKGFAGLVRTDFSSDTLYKTPDEWARAQFIAYYVSVKSTMTSLGIALSDPFGAVLLADTTGKHDDSLWAGDAYSTFFSSDTSIGAWSEFIRYTAKGIYGYELYVIGDTADIRRNLGFYVAILDGVCLNSPGLSIRPALRKTNGVQAAHMPLTFPADLLGRRFSIAKDYRKPASGLYILPMSRSLVLQ